jgi:hypothetical protein
MIGMMRAVIADPLVITNQIVTLNQLVDKQVVVKGVSELHLTQATAPMDANSTIAMTSQNGWVIFTSVRPENVVSQYLRQMTVNGAKAAQGVNVRVVQYVNGTVVIPQGKDFKPLVLYDGTNLTGTADTLGIGLAIGESLRLNDKISSFRLSRGYLAVFAQNLDGTGASRVYIADSADVAFNLPPELNNAISLIRVSEFRWAGKKGMGGDWIVHHQLFNLSNFYNWGASNSSSLNTQFIPQAWGKATANSAAEINTHPDYGQLLTFNEPDNPDDQSGRWGHLSVIDTAVASYRHLLATGLRLGSPAVTDNQRGWNWLDTFMLKAGQQNLRVDFLAIHYYQKTTPNDFYNKLKTLHAKFNKPIWVTEFNYGANWTALPVDSMAYYTGLKAFIDMLDTCDFVEHYFIFPWWGAYNPVLSIFRDSAGTAPSIAGRWFSAKKDYYGYRTSLINNGIPIDYTGVVNQAPAAPGFGHSPPAICVERGAVRCRFTLDEPANVAIDLYTLSGRACMQVPRQQYAAGAHVVNLSPGRIGRGVYTWRFQSERGVSAGRIVMTAK